MKNHDPIFTNLDLLIIAYMISGIAAQLVEMIWGIGNLGVLPYGVFTGVSGFNLLLLTPPPKK